MSVLFGDLLSHSYNITFSMFLYLVYNMLYSILDMTKWTTEEIEVDFDDEDMDCGPVVEGSKDEFDYMSEYEDSASDSEESASPVACFDVKN